MRERLSGGSAVVHCHMLFHLAHPFIRDTGRVQVERALERLIDRHGEANYLDCTLKVTFPTNPNGVYLLKGGGPKGYGESSESRAVGASRKASFAASVAA